jgi:hypothetical protein
VDQEEMIRILEEIIRDEETNPTARVTAIRALREIAPPEVDSHFSTISTRSGCAAAESADGRPSRTPVCDRGGYVPTKHRR